MSQEDLRSMCRTNIEAFEKWARIIIDKELTNAFGVDYFDANINQNNPIINKKLKDKVNKMFEENPRRFQRKIDTLFLDDIISILCKEDLYKKCFKAFLDGIYPDGKEEARTFLERIIPIRNCLSHSNPISVRDAERCVCYTNDFIDGVKLYFENKGEERMFNVPNAIKLNDSLGNEIYLNKDISYQNIEIKDPLTGKLQKLYIGETYSVTLTLDPSFSDEEYKFDWSIPSTGRLNATSSVEIKITENMVAERFWLLCTIRSNKNWHRYDGYDQQFGLVLQVPPPQ